MIQYYFKMLTPCYRRDKDILRRKSLLNVRQKKSIGKHLKDMIKTLLRILLFSTLILLVLNKSSFHSLGQEKQGQWRGGATTLVST